jgi:hypothetical protein
MTRRTGLPGSDVRPVHRCASSISRGSVNGSPSISLATVRQELCGRLGDEVDQAAW